MTQDYSPVSLEEHGTQQDLRFGENGKRAWIYVAWPFGPLPGALILLWGMIETVKTPGHLDVLVTVGICLFFAVWILAAGIIMNLEGLRAVQHVLLYESTATIKPYFGRAKTIRRDVPVELVPHTVSRKYLWATLGTTFMAVDRPNWRVVVDGEKTFLMNGEHFCPHDIFRNAESLGSERSGKSPK